MPYLDEERKNMILTGNQPFDNEPTAGDLNFAITTICESYREGKGDRYATFNDIIGALECAKQEYYRRVVTPYEDTKIRDNGDVYREIDNG